MGTFMNERTHPLPQQLGGNGRRKDARRHITSMCRSNGAVDEEHDGPGPESAKKRAGPKLAASATNALPGSAGGEPSW